MKKLITKGISTILAVTLSFSCLSAANLKLLASTGTEQPVKIPITRNMVHDEQVAFYSAHYFHSAKLVADENDKLPEICPSQPVSGSSLGLENFGRNTVGDKYVATFDNNYTPLFYIDLGAYYRVTDVLLCTAAQNSVSGTLYLGDHFDWTKICDIDYSVGATLAKPYKISNYSTFDKPVRYIRINGGINVLAEVGIYGYKVASLTEEDMIHDKPSTYKGVSDNLSAGKAIGANIFVNNDMTAIGGMGNVREFHDLGFSLGDDGKNYFSPSSPANKGQWSFDNLYKTMFEKGISAIPCLQLTHSWIYGDYKETITNPDGTTSEVGFVYGNDKTNSPSYGGIATENAADYEKHANVLYNYAARYGSNKNIDPSTLNLADNQEVKVGLGYINTIENGNEQNANWWAEGKKSYMSPYEMAAQCSADYDGHEGTIPNAGVKTADPNMKLALAGLVGGNVIPYLDGMKKWFAYNRSDNYFAIDTINYHMYMTDADYYILNDAGKSTGVYREGITKKNMGAPEYALACRSMAKNVSAWIDANTPGRDSWLSEFNVYTWDLEFQTGGVLNQNKNEAFQLSYAQRLARANLTFLADGVDRLSMFQLRNEQSGAFADMGLVWEYGNETKKLAWYFVSMLSDTLRNADLIDAYESDTLYKYTFRDRDTSELIYAVWSPTTDGSSTNYTLNVGSAEKAEKIVPVYGYTEGQISSIAIEDGTVHLVADETVQLIRTSGTDVQRSNHTIKRIGIDRIQLGYLSAACSKAVYDANEIVDVSKGDKPKDLLLSEFYKLFDEQSRMPLSPVDIQIVEYTKDFVSAPKSECLVSMAHSIGEYPYDMLVALDDYYTITDISVFDSRGVGVIEVYDDLTGTLIYSSGLKETTYRVTNLNAPYASTNRLRIVKHNAAGVGELMLFGYPANSKVGADVEKIPGVLTVSDKNSFWVSFNTDGGSYIAPMRNIESGTIITLPSNPTKSGYVFGGWYLDKALTVPFNVREGITSNLMLNAKWLEAGLFPQIKLYPSMIIGTNKETTLIDEQNTLDAGGKPPESFGYNQETLIDLGAIYNIDQLSFYDFRGVGSGKIYLSTDNINWELVVDDKLEKYYEWSNHLVNSKQARYIKMIRTALVSELLVYGTPVSEITDTYTVTFDSNGGNGMASVTGIAYGTTVELPNPERFAYRFDGWYTLPNMLTEFKTDTPVTANVLLVAKWIPTIAYSVSFDSCTGDKIATSNGIGYGQTVTLPTPTKYGFIFTGWYKDLAYSQPFNDTTPVTESLHLYARWAKRRPLSSDMFLSGVGASALTDAQTGFGYGEELDAQSAKAQPFLIDLGASYKVNSFSILSAQGTLGSSVKIRTGMTLDSLTQTVNSSISANVSVNNFMLSTECRYIEIQIITAAREFYIQLDVLSVEYSFNLNGGVGVSPESTRYLSGTTVKLPDSSGFSREDYIFAGWALTPNATEPIAEIVADSTDAVLYAVWIEKTKYSVTVDIVGQGSVSGQGSFEVGTLVRLVAVNSGNFRFVGFKTSDGVIVCRKQVYEFVPEADTFLTAVFENIEEVTISVTDTEVNIGSVTGLKEKYLKGESVNLLAEAAPGYVFSGWYQKRGSTVIWLSSSPLLQFTAYEDATIKPAFKEQDVFEVTFIGKEKTPVFKEFYTDGAIVTFPEAFTLKIPGYLFTGWYLDAMLTEKAPDILTVTGGLVLYAGYEREEKLYTVTVTGGFINDSASLMLPYDKLALIKLVPASIPLGMVFSHWEKNGKLVSTETEYLFVVTENCVINAVYSAIQVAPKPIINIVSTVSENAAAIYTVERNVPSGYKLIESGLLVTKENTNVTDELFAIGMPNAVKLASIFDKAAGTTVQKVKTAVGTVLYARAYLIYEDAQGQIIIVYSDITQVTVVA